MYTQLIIIATHFFTMIYQPSNLEHIFTPRTTIVWKKYSKLSIKSHDGGKIFPFMSCGT